MITSRFLGSKPRLSTGELPHLPLFQPLPSDALMAFQPVACQRTFPAGVRIMTFEHSSDFVYIILKGGIKISALHPNGAEVVVALLGPGELFGKLIEATPFDYSGMVETMHETTLLWLKHSDFQDCLQTIPMLGYEVLRSLARQLYRTDFHFHALLHLDVAGRLAYRLLHCVQMYGRVVPTTGDIVIPLRLTQSDLAHLIGASRVRVNHILNQLKEQRVLSVKERYEIIIHDPKFLSAMCQYHRPIEAEKSLRF
jgi:CRP/FNR family cyclic AMP-dependent transcriptional regulator